MTSVIGTNRDDVLEAASSGEILIGGRGSDVLTGGAGNDVFTTDAIDGASNRSDQDIIALGDVAPGTIGNDVITDFDTNNFNGGENNFDTLSFTFGSHDFNLSTGADIVNFVRFIESDGDLATGAIQDGNDILLVFARDENGAITDSVTLQDVIGYDGITQSRLNDASIDRLTEADVFADASGSAPQDPGASLPAGNTLSGTDGADILVGTDGVDIIAGGNGADNLAGNAGNDILIGGAGNDFLTGDAGADTFVFTAGSGFDTISDFEAGRDQIDLTDFGFTNFDQLNLVEQDGFVNLFIDQNTSIALTNLRNVDALSANDFILQGGIVDSSVPDTPVEDTPVEDTPAEDTAVEIVETTNTITGTNGADTIIGTNQADAIFGGAGNDTLAGDGGNDIIDGGTGNDFIYGEAGADIFVFTEGSGFNTVNDFEAGTDRIDVSDFGFSDFNDLNLVVQNNTVVLFLDANTSVALVGVRNIDDLSADDFILSDGVVNDPVADTPVEEPIDLSGAIVGTNGADILVGTNGNDTIFGGNGNDSIAGDGGNDVIIGGAGNDFIYGDAGADIFVFTEGSGFNTVNDFVSGTDRIDVSEFGFSDFNELNLVEQNNTVFLFLDENTSVEFVGVRNIDDLSADDFILEGGGVDVVVADTPVADTPVEDTAVEDANDGPMTLIGTNGADTLTGGTGNDAIAGNAGNDTLIGAAGNDFLSGDAGADRFVFEAGSGFDTINDFEVGTDQIDLSDFDFDNFNELNIVEQNNSVFVFIDENTSIELANIDDADELSAEDFIL